MKVNKGKFFYWLMASGILLLGYGQFNLPVNKKSLHISKAAIPASQSIHQNYSLKLTAEAASFEGICVPGRSFNGEDKSKPYAKYITLHPSFDAHAQLASVYIHRFLAQAYFSNFLYLLYCVLII